MLPTGPWSPQDTGDEKAADHSEEAASAGDVELVLMIPAGGANANAGSPSGRSPLMAASLGGNAEVVACLLDHGADASVKDNLGSTVLLSAAFAGHADVVRLLPDRGFDVNA